MEHLDLLAARIASLADGCHAKEPEQLTDLERLALAFMAGCEMEFTGTGVRAKNPFGIVKIGGVFQVGERRG